MKFLLISFLLTFGILDGKEIQFKAIENNKNAELPVLEIPNFIKLYGESITKCSRKKIIVKAISDALEKSTKFSVEEKKEIKNKIRKNEPLNLLIHDEKLPSCDIYLTGCLDQSKYAKMVKGYEHIHMKIITKSSKGTVEYGK